MGGRRLRHHSAEHHLNAKGGRSPNGSVEREPVDPADHLALLAHFPQVRVATGNELDLSMGLCGMRDVKDLSRANIILPNAFSQDQTNE